MIAARSRTAGLCGLHRYSTESQPLEQIGNGLFVTLGHTLRVSQKVIKTVLKHVPGIRLDRFRAHQVGDHPLGSGRNLGGQIGVTGGGHHLRGGGDHVNVRDDHLWSRAGECLLGVMVGNRGTERRETVHGSRRRQCQIRLAVVVRGKFAKVVDDS